MCDSVQLQYVGTDTYDSQKMRADISLALPSLKMISNRKGKIFFLTPDTYIVVTLNSYLYLHQRYDLFIVPCHVIFS